MRLVLPSGHIDLGVINMIDTILLANDLPRINRQDRIRGFVSIPAEAASNVTQSLKAVGLAA